MFSGGPLAIDCTCQAIRGGWWALGTLDPSVAVEVPGPARAAVSFLLTVLFGGFVLYRDGGRIERAVEASASAPLTSVLYGFVAFGVALFLAVFAATQLNTVGAGGTVIAITGAVLVGAVVVVLGCVGFAVAGVWLAGALGVADPWIGLVAVGVLTALAWAVFPVVIALLVWFAVAAAGLGGPARLWLHQSAGDVPEAT